jgi:glucokinase
VNPGDCVLAVDLGGTHLRCAAVSADGRVLARHEMATPSEGPRALAEAMVAVAREQQCPSAVVGLPGRIDYRRGRLENAPNLSLTWTETLTEAWLHERVGLPVALANDADLAAVGEACFGAGRPYHDVVYVTFSTGIGAGVVLGGRLVHGRRSMAEVGHTIVDLTGLVQGRPATVEELASGTALGQLALAAGLPADGAQVVAAVARGDAAAVGVWRALTDAAAACVANLAWVFTPQAIVVGGGLGLVGDVLLDPIREKLAAEGPPGLDPPITVIEAGLGDDAGLVGAAAWDTAFVRTP